MTRENESQAQAKNEPQEVMTFQFSESKHQIRNSLINNQPWFVAKDVCDVLEISNSRDALLKLDADEKLMSVFPTSGQNRKMWVISESGLYALIMRSNKPQAKVFRKWITSEVIPAIMKKGYYGKKSAKKDDYVDARDIPFYTQQVNGYEVRCIEFNGVMWVSVNDVNKSIHSSTGSYQLSKKLNAKQQLAKKIWLFGNTHPAWFTNELGLQLILAGSRKLRETKQLNLFNKQGGVS